MILMNNSFWLQIDGSINLANWQVMSSTDRIVELSKIDNLPINSHLSNIRYAVKNSAITFISADTWAGKTTQIPPALLRLWGRPTRISVAEPRVINTIEAATRVSRELIARTWDHRFMLWDRIGYRTWKWSVSTPWSELLFVTDWLQLLRQTVSGILPDILIVDEVHNFSIATEFLIAQSKRVMKKTKNRMKLVLMSATVDIGMLQDYFSSISRDIPVFDIPWRTFPVEKYFRSDTEFLPSILELAKKQSMKDWEEEYKNILVFVEWKKTIESTIKFLKEKLPHYEILPVHSELPVIEQRLVMEKWDRPRIIVATNIAQEWITIPYINAVVDNWFCKKLTVNEKWIPELRKRCISNADTLQRAWRAWRVIFWEYIRANATRLDKLSLFPDWEIQNITAEQFILWALMTWFDPLNELLLTWEKTFMHKPSIELFRLSYDNLIKLGAITKSHKVTLLWKKLLLLPVEPHVWRMLIEWIKRWCGANMVDICAIIDNKWFFAKSELWKKFVPGKFKNDSDLIAHRELFNLITTREPIDGETLHKLHLYWLNKWQIAEYKRISNSTKDKMLFEVIDLTLLWVKSKSVYEILSTIANLKQRLESNWEILEYSESFVEVSKSILSWMLNNVYTWNKKGKKFKHHYKWELQKPLTSVLWPSNKYFYAGSPFIIWWDDEEEDLYLLSFITRVESEWTEEVARSFIDEEYRDITFWKKRVWYTKRWNDKLKTCITAKRVASLSWLEISSTFWEVPEEKEKIVLFYNRLPDFLVNENRAIKNFIASYRVWKFNVEQFKLLIRLICKDLYSNFDMKKFEKYRKGFINDTQILFYFKESKNPRIVEFLSNPYKEFYDNSKIEIMEDEVTIENDAAVIEDEIKIEARLKAEVQAAKKKSQNEKKAARIARAKAKEALEPKVEVEPKKKDEPEPVKLSRPPLEKRNEVKFSRKAKKVKNSTEANVEGPKIERRRTERRVNTESIPLYKLPEVKEPAISIEAFNLEIEKLNKVVKQFIQKISEIKNEELKLELNIELEWIIKYLSETDIRDFSVKKIRARVTNFRNRLNKALKLS